MMARGAPELAIVVDTEEEFDWAMPFSRDERAVTAIPAQARAQEIYARFGVVPTYVVDHPVATDPVAAGFLRSLKECGAAEIGAHLHPWVTPPHDETVNAHNSYHCNLAPVLERAKLAALTDAIEAAFGERPNIFKAGRYGFGPSTQRALVGLGYEVDCSVVPHTDLSGDGGPDFRGFPDAPYWLDESAGLLEVPLSVGFHGAAARLGAKADWLFDHPGAGRLRIPGVLARTGLVARARLTPEGTSAAEQCRLIAAMAARGHRLFTITYHSPSLAPGHTPYVRDGADLQRFLTALETVLAFFRDEIGGRFTTLSAVRRDFEASRAAA
jgi:hypothetical protein